MTAPTSDQYITESEFREYIKDDSRDRSGPILAAIAAASRSVDSHCGRYFNQRDEVQYFSPDPANRFAFWLLELDDMDIATTSGLTVESEDDNSGNYGVLWTIDVDFICEPINQSSNGITPWPYTQLHAIGNKIFPIKYTPTRRETVRVTGRYGWPTAPPDAVKQATKIIAAQLWKMGEAPLGVAGFNEFGSVRVRDIPQAESLLRPYARTGGYGVA